MKSFKQIAKMSHGGHYCWGGKVMKKAEGGSVGSPAKTLIGKQNDPKRSAVKKKISEDIIPDEISITSKAMREEPLGSVAVAGYQAARKLYEKMSGAEKKSDAAKKKLKDMEDEEYSSQLGTPEEGYAAKEYAYKRGGKVMKKAEGGDVKVMEEDKDRYERGNEGVKKTMGLPVSVYKNGKYDSKSSEEMMRNNFKEGLRQDREDFGKEMKKKYGDDAGDYSYEFPNTKDNVLPKGKSYKTKAYEAMKRGGKVMKKVEGGPVKKYKTIEDIIEETKGIKVNPEVRRKSTIPDMTPEEMRRVKATSDAEERKRRYDEETEDMRENPINKAKGGVARPFWETKNPKKESKKMTPAQKAFAKARAKKAGRPYPNLIDNAAASRRAK